MRRSFFRMVGGFVLASALAAPALAAPALAAPGAAGDWQGQAAIRFTGTSTLHDFEGTARSELFVLRAAAMEGAAEAGVASTRDADSASASHSESARFDADVVVPVSTMDTDNGARDERMREMLHADRCPTIEARVRGVDADALREGATLPLVLEICDRVQTLEAVVHSPARSADRVTFEADVELSLVAFGLEAPRVLFVQVGDVVRLVADVSLERR